MDRLEQVISSNELELVSETLRPIKTYEEIARNCLQQIESMRKDLAATNASTQKLIIEEAELQKTIENKCQNLRRLKKEVEKYKAIFGALESDATNDEIENEKTEQLTTSQLNMLKSMFGMDFDVKINEDNCIEVEVKLTEDHTAKLMFDAFKRKFSLLSLHPPHPKLSELQKTLQESNDVRGFLCCLKEVISTNERAINY